MYVNGLRKFLYAGALLALAPLMAGAESAEPIKAPAPTVGASVGPAPAMPSAPAITSAPTAGCGAAAPCGGGTVGCGTCKIKVCEMVSEPYDYTKTCYKPVTKEVACTGYKTEMVSEAKTCTYTVYNKVCETVMESRCVTKKIPVWEEKTEMVSKWTKVQVTEMKEKTVRSHHFECCTVPSCDPCACPKTVRKLVSECHTECVPVCKTKLVKECVPVCKKVCTYQCVTETIQVPVTKVKCIPEIKTSTYTVCKAVQVPYTYTKCVTEMVPTTEVVHGCRMVPHWVEKEVAIATSCSSCSSGDSGFCGGCESSCGCGKHSRFRHEKKHSCGCGL